MSAGQSAQTANVLNWTVLVIQVRLGFLQEFRRVRVQYDTECQNHVMLVAMQSLDVLEEKNVPGATEETLSAPIAPAAGSRFEASGLLSHI
ncbi:hypothetical protein N7491_002747 [Penicillium cf. griseofulvum]|uniref:Uncharacterized protein n=1 Tax=Penicillium cf. griseofulvum TaxID=2972120 RepID=A0A9W9MSH7_9EURO|nr:hypothetical protein N7472_003086 [Penicillium cf. griseofulvum]KAJ5440341.1 hypothetical protein N7491_002747 [Penicillium cf. griseofulvum]